MKLVVRTMWRCEHCNGLYNTNKEAVACAAKHIHRETWVESRTGGGYRVFSNCKAGSWGSLEWAKEKVKAEEGCNG